MKRFLIVGDANVDIIVQGLRSQPVLGQELRCDDFAMVLGGSAANCASLLAGLGASVDFWGKVGKDTFGDFVISEFKRRGITAAGVVQDPAVRTGVCIALAYAEDRALVSYLGSIAAFQLSDVPLDEIRHFDHLHSASIFIQHGLRPGFTELFRIAKGAGLTTSLDSGWDPDERWQVDFASLLRHVDVFLPNEAEALQITGSNDVEEAAESLSQHVETAVIKQGGNGAIVRQANQVWKVSAFDVDIVDATGAGDCFNAGFLYARIAQGLDVPAALDFANACGALAATQPGGSLISMTANDVVQFVNNALKRRSTKS